MVDRRNSEVALPSLDRFIGNEPMGTNCGRGSSFLATAIALFPEQTTLIEDQIAFMDTVNALVTNLPAI